MERSYVSEKFGCDGNVNTLRNKDSHGPFLVNNELGVDTRMSTENTPCYSKATTRPSPEPQGGLSNLFAVARDFKSKFVVCTIR